MIVIQIETLQRFVLAQRGFQLLRALVRDLRVVQVQFHNRLVGFQKVANYISSLFLLI